MARSLVIVESPAKARTINRYLGKNFVVKSSVGHVRDLATSKKRVDPKERAKEAAKTRKLSPKKKAERKKKRAREQLVRRMGVDPSNGWKAEYEVLPPKEKVVTELKKIAERSDHIYLATDLDREGEAIAWHLQEVIGGDPTRFSRVVFNEITKTAIQEAFKNPGKVDEKRVNAQKARRFFDRVVGYELSPLLWAKVGRNLSAGRVQSVAVRLVVEREREIRAFIPEEYWEGFADLKRPGEATVIRFRVHKDGSKTFRPDSAEVAGDALGRIKKASFIVKKREDRPTSTKPNAPFITSTLQQAASTRLSFSVSKTMRMAQKLYEAGQITYMRTDSTNLSSEALFLVRNHIKDAYGERYIPDEAVFYASKADAQEAHEAIRPTDVNTRGDDLGDLDPDARRLYDLIWRQFVACQMTRAEYLSTTITVEGDGFELRIRGRIMQFDGYTRVLPPASRKEDEIVLPEFEVGEVLDFIDAEVIQHFTKPPPRFGEASLVSELEKRGIGRPSTYASIISTIGGRGYVTLRENRRFHAEKVGELVTNRLVECFSDLMDYSFTDGMERELDQIAGGSLEWRNVLDELYGDFSGKLEKAESDRDGMRTNEPTSTDIECLVCEEKYQIKRHMKVRTASTGVFLACPGYSLPKKDTTYCDHTVNLIPGDEFSYADEDEESEAKILRAKRRCSQCSSAMDSYLIDEKRKLHLCGNNPDCDEYSVEEGEFRLKGYDGPILECDKCGAEMRLTTGRFGPYFRCENDPKHTRKLLRNGEPAPPKADPVDMPELPCLKVDDHYVLRDGAAGIFLAASQFPKNRETRAPLVSEIKPHANELDPKFGFLLEAPEHDPKGNAAIIKFSRKTKEQFLSSENEGKATKWRAFYRDGQWGSQS